MGLIPPGFCFLLGRKDFHQWKWEPRLKAWSTGAIENLAWIRPSRTGLDWLRAPLTIKITLVTK